MTRHIVARVGLAAALAVTVSADVKIKTHHDETFAFRGLRTWAWHPEGTGDVKMMLTASDDPDAVRNRLEPTILAAVAAELQRRGWTRVTTGAPDLHVTYYVLISASTSAQTMGQFLPAVAEWGLPPITGATQSFRVVEQGSLVLDFSAPSRASVVWRGIAQAEIDREGSDERRLDRIRTAVRDMLKKFPPR